VFATFAVTAIECTTAELYMRKNHFKSQADVPMAPASPPMHARNPPAGNQEPGPDLAGTLINLCGRQRMLSQRIVLHLVLSAQGQTETLAIASDALTLFSDCHEVLSRGKGILPAPWTPALQEAFFGLQGADAPIRTFIRMARQALIEVEQGIGQPPTGTLAPALSELVTAATTVLAHLNRLTQCYETAAHDSARCQRQQLIDLIGRIHNIAREARVVSFKARVASARAGEAGQEFGGVASVLSEISEQIAELAETARQVH
jgi:hypothetical protein